MAERVLVVDDESSVCQLIQETLEHEGYEVTSADSAKRALTEIRKAEFSLLISDIRMPEMDGIALLQKVRECSPDTEIILLSAVVEVDVAVSALKLGAFDYIAKPFNLDELIVKTKQALEHRRLVHQNRQHLVDREQTIRTEAQQFGAAGAFLWGMRGRERGFDRLSPMGVLSASVAHELNNPLSAILGFSDLILAAGQGADQTRKNAKLIREQGERIRHVTQHLLGLSRDWSSERLVQDLNEVADEALLLAEPHLFTFGKIEVVKDFSAEDLSCPIDRAQVQQVLLQLMINAAQAMSEGGRITIRTYSEDRSEEGLGMGFSVSDTGPGIPLEDQERVFKPFVTTWRGRMGLGLKICTDIVQAHGGTIDLVRDPDEGASFRVWFPCPRPRTTQKGRSRSMACP
ncbi:MAG: response regulator [Planctomycetota bacterium]|nr:response regulator [Planctomycetota bacterium]